MDKNDIAKEWFRFAEMDLASAEHLTHNMNPPPLEIICFHCQQSAEKKLKGLMVLHDEYPPKIHDLLGLLKICGEIYVDLYQLSNKCNFLNKYSVAPRYPDEIQITDDDVKLCLRYANDINEFVKELVESINIQNEI
ncbi:MAG: HEPN domain-containing protein [Planctomycetaceae bacterium]|jgi:HEPN domain-containing protein|nr:HEPN domain-containing protein [Planctomycetaceae bacterium]